MLESMDVTSLEKWKANYADPKNKTLDIITKSAVVSLEVLQQFLDDAKINSPGFNGVRIYFIRFDKPNDKLISDTEYDDVSYKYVSEVNNSGFSQLSLAFVPVKDFDPLTLAGKDFVQPANNKIHTLAICPPSDWAAGYTQPVTGTGLCPPKCKN